MNVRSSTYIKQGFTPLLPGKSALIHQVKGCPVGSMPDAFSDRRNAFGEAWVTQHERASQANKSRSDCA